MLRLVAIGEFSRVFEKYTIFRKIILAGQEPIVSFDKFDLNNVLIDRLGVEKCIPQRFEMAQLDGVLYLDREEMVAVGYKQVTNDEFWIRGHMPNFALMPGVIMCEAAAQLIAYMSMIVGVNDDGTVGFGGLNNVRFRGMVLPGDTLVLMAKIRKLRKNVMVICDFQGFVNDKLVVDGEIKGIILPADAMKKAQDS